MNSFLQGCCSLPPSTPSFSEGSGPKSNISRASKAAYENSSEIILIKQCRSTWRDDDDKSVKTMVSRSSLDVNTGSMKSTSRIILRRKNSSFTSQLLALPEDDIETRLDLWIQSTAEPPDDSEYAACDSRKHLPQNTSKFLDWITMCFWKCSPGCQQIPDFNT